MISPCIKACMIDKETRLCAGCLRTMDEIRDWTIMTDGERQAVMDRLSKDCR